MAQFKVTEARLRLIKERQWADRWGRDYVASIWATPAEAPGISTGSILRPRKLGEREFHTLSAAETAVALLCLHHPACWDIHEQRVMFPVRRSHPLQGHSFAPAVEMAAVRGTVDIAAELGMKHPRVVIRSGGQPEKWPVVPFPYMSDLLLFMRDESGAYVVNMPVKKKFEDFRRKGPNKKGRELPDDPSTIARQELEKRYYESADIRTQPVSQDQLPEDLQWNLRDLFLDDTYPVQVSDGQRNDIVGAIRETVGEDIPGHVTVKKLAAANRMNDREVTAILKQAIWRREIRVDLFRPVLIDRRLRPEREDVFARFNEWFVR